MHAVNQAAYHGVWGLAHVSSRLAQWPVFDAAIE
jgi:hypothetical protein